MTQDFTHHICKQFCNRGSQDGLSQFLSAVNSPHTFRSFARGLTEFIQKCGYSDSGNPEKKTDWLYASLSRMGVSVSRSTVRDWFLGQRIPRLVSNSRILMYQVCFALNASLEQVQWFFSHVYFDRSFNCHTLEEAVYYYCFRQHLSYNKAKEYLGKIAEFPSLPSNRVDQNISTGDICLFLDGCPSEKEFLAFFEKNKSLFVRWNQTAKTYLRKFMDEIKGKKADRDLLKKDQKGLQISPEELKNAGLVIQEYLYQKQLSAKRASVRYFSIAGKNITSIDFMLERILSVSAGLGKNSSVPASIRTNFPSKKVFSDLLNKLDTSTSYSAVRKALILLSFYHFWCMQLLYPVKDDAISLSGVYQEETDALLVDCGYQELFPGNPYDFLFLWAANSNEPLSTLREIVECLED